MARRLRAPRVGVPREQAEGFVDAAEQLVKDVVQVLADTFPDPVELP